jgi:beta-lactamase class A
VKNSLLASLKNLPRDVKIGIAAKNITTDKTYFFHEHDVFGAASVIKIAVACTLFQEAEKGNLDPYKSIEILDDDIFDAGLGDCGVLKYFNRESGISLYNACFLMLALSDNTATNVVLRFVSQLKVNQFLADNNFEKTRLTAQRISNDLLGQSKNYLGNSTPSEMLYLLEGLCTNRFLTEKYSKAILQMMSLQQIDHKIPRMLPSLKNYSNKKAEIVEIASKTGEISPARINNDVAVITTKDKQKIVIVIFTAGIKDKDSDLYAACIDHESAKLMAGLALVLYNTLKREH